ncbi:baseplate J/gp47 family protein [Acetoanaerobium noterae]|uniref:baseplate J/gp47 family protein n=1 Tax=Acetoanaerobium noterae TaxID=745369 RepID=UPI00333E554E
MADEYSDISLEVLLNRMLDRISDKKDKRQGSLTWDSISPTAIELRLLYIELEKYYSITFADTATRPYLIKRAAERGIIPEPATKAILKGEFNIDVPIGSRFSLAEVNYKVFEKISTGVFKLECETAGTIGHANLGSIVPIEYITGLTSAELTEILIPGEDEEDTEVFRQRYFQTLQQQAYGGNIADYKEKTLKLQGVGGVKVYPVWNGGGTVKLVIQDSTYGIPSEALVEAVQTAVDPVVNQGKGIGFAPIGHVVTVEGITSQTVNISTTITFQDGWSWVDVEPYANQVIDAYFLELSEAWDNESNLIVRISQIETRFLNLAGVLDIGGTLINGLAQNLVLGENKIPVRGSVSG